MKTIIYQAGNTWPIPTELIGTMDVSSKNSTIGNNVLISVKKPLPEYLDDYKTDNPLEYEFKCVEAISYCNLTDEKEDVTLTLSIMDNLLKHIKTYKPDWDDVAEVFELPCGIEIEGLTVVSNETVDPSNWSIFDGSLEINTLSELKKLMSMSYDDVLNYTKERDEDFPIDDYYA